MRYSDYTSVAPRGKARGRYRRKKDKSYRTEAMRIARERRRLRVYDHDLDEECDCPGCAPVLVLMIVRAA